MNRDLFAAAGGVVDATTDPYFNSTTLLLSGDGTNGAQNNTFVDSSVNNATITRAGTPTQGSFSPFSQTGWSGYFDGSSYLSCGTGYQTFTGDFTIELWANFANVNSGYDYYLLDSVNIANNFSIEAYNNSFRYSYSGTSRIVASYTIAAGVWYHIALVRSISTVTMYVNGSSIGTYNQSGSINNSPGPWLIGTPGGLQAWKMNGYISNLRIVNGTAVYTGNFTPPTAPLTATQAGNGSTIQPITGTATSLLTLQDNRFKDNALTPNTITVSGTPSVQAFSPFAPTAAYSLPAAAAGSAYFNGSSYISVPDSTAFTMGSGDFTLEAWVYLTTSGVSRVIIGTCDAAGSAGSMSFVLGVNASNNATFAIGYAGALYTSTNTATVPTNQWVHIAGVRNGGGIYAYLNGIQSTSNTSMAALAITDSTQIVAIGRNGAYNGEYVTGYISNLRIVKGTAVYTAAFTPPSAPLTAVTGTNLLTLQDSTFKDNATPPNTITASNPAPVIQSFTPFTQVWGGYFDGSGYSTLTMSNTTSLAMGTGNFTIEFWINTSNIVQTGYVLQTDTGANTLYVSISGSTIRLTNQSTVFAVTPTLLSNTWYHIAVVRSGTSSVIYTNGVAGTAVSCSIDFTQNGLTIGGNSFIGYISNLRITKGVAVYTGAFTPPAKTLSATQAAGTNISAIYPGQTSVLTLQDPTFKDNAILPNTITAAGTPKTQLLSAPFTSAATVDPVNGAGYFNGTSNLAVPAGAPFNLTTVDFCIEMWVYPIAQSQYGALLSLDLQDFPLVISWAGVLGTNISFSAGTSGAWFANTNGMSFGTTITNNWTHLLITRVGDSWRTFQDGVLRGSTTQAGSIGDSAGSVYVGSNGAAGGFSAAYISNLRIIKGTGNVPAAYQTSSTTLGTTIFTPPSAPLTAVTGTSLLTLQDTTFKDNSTNAAVITAGGTPVMRAFTPFASNWGGYFASGEMLSIASSSATTFATGDFTIEFWVNAAAWASGDYNRLARIGDIQIGVYSYSGQYLTYYNGTGFVIGSGILPATNKWHHIAVCRSSGTSKLYLNGVQVGSSFVDSANFGAGSIDINNNTPYPTQAYISNFRIVKGTAVYTGNFQPPSAPLTAITNTSLLTLQNNTFIDNSTNALAITATGAPKTQLLQLPFTSSITKVAAPWNISVTAPLATVGGSMYFDGSSYLSVPPTSNFAFGTGDFTVECYIYGNSTTFASGAIFSPNVWNGGSLYWAILAAGGNVTWQSSHGNTNLFSISAVAYYNTWLHITVVRSSGTTKMYFNGVQVASAADSNNYVLTTTYVIARNGDGPYNMGAGYISNFRIVKGTAVYTGAFTPPAAPPQPTQTPGLLGTNVNAIDGTNTSLLLLGSNSGIYDATAKNDIITVGNAQVSSTQIKYGTGAMYFDGTGDYLTMPASPNFAFGTGDYTVEFWMYQTYAANQQVMLEVGRLAATASPGFQFDTINGPLTVYYGSTIGTALSSGITLTINVWYHIALTRQAGSTKLFVNGTQGGSTVTDNTNYTTGAVWVGATAGGAAAYYFGYLDDLRITKGIARYTTTFTPPTKAMIGQ